MTTKHYILGELACALKRAQLLQVEIETIMVSLKFDIIQPAAAVDLIYQHGIQDLTSLSFTGFDPKPKEAVDG